MYKLIIMMDNNIIHCLQHPVYKGHAFSFPSLCMHKMLIMMDYSTIREFQPAILQSLKNH